MIVGFALADLYFDGTVKGLKLILEAVYFLIVGLIIGFVAWWIHEGRYQNARIEARINSNAEQSGSDIAKHNKGVQRTRN